MKFRRQIFLPFATVLFVCVSTSYAYDSYLQDSSTYAQQKIRSGKFPIHSACVMPLQGHIFKISPAGIGLVRYEEMPQESKTWSKSIETIVESHLEADGISIQSAANPLSSGASEADINEVIAQIQRKFQSVSVLMNKKPRAIAKGAYTLGDQVGLLPCSDDSNILVFIQGQGRTGNSFPDAANLFVTMADVKTGEILALIRLYPVGNSLSYPDMYFGPGLDIELLTMNIQPPHKKAKTKEH